MSDELSLCRHAKRSDGSDSIATIPVQTPSEQMVRQVDMRLRNAYGLSRLGNKEDPLDELIFIILSGATQEATYMATFDALQKRFPNWEVAAQADIEEIKAAIRFGGLAEKKSVAISNLLKAIVKRVGRADLAFLHQLDDQAVEEFLRQLPGVGPKTARCVLSYSLGRPAFAVDSHVSRIVRRLGWSKHHRLTDLVHDRLQEMVPLDIRISLHVNFVIHGRKVCVERKPRCGSCVIADLCPSAFKADE